MVRRREVTGATSIGVGACERGCTANGLRVVVWPSQHAPVARLRMFFPAAGADGEPEPSWGIASLVAPLLRAACRRYSAGALERLVEAMATDAVIDVQWEGASLTLDALASDTATALDLLLDLVAYPVFPQNAIDALRARRLEQLRQQAHDPAAVATNGFYRALFAGTRDGAPLFGTADGLASVSREAILDFHGRQYAPCVGSLIVTGDADADAIMQQAERYEGSGENENTPPLVGTGRPAIPAVTAAANRVLLVDRPGALRTEIRVGQCSVGQLHSDAPALPVLGALVGGTPFGRLGRRLRRESGYCYHVVGNFTLRRKSGAFMVSASVPTESAGRAVSEVLSELAQVREVRVGREEIAAAAGQLEATIIQSWCCVSGQSDGLTAVLANDLEDDYGARCLEAIRSVTPDRLLELARTHLAGERMTIVAVGPINPLRSQLRHLGDVIERA